jgi:hypothetical protein
MRRERRKGLREAGGDANIAGAPIPLEAAFRLAAVSSFRRYCLTLAPRSAYCAYFTVEAE